MERKPTGSERRDLKRPACDGKVLREVDHLFLVGDATL
jgi:hypothetical protein